MASFSILVYPFVAVQIKQECDKFGSTSGIKNTVVYGGVPKGGQVRTLKNGVEILIATPGRLIDHLEQGSTNLKRVTYLVMDEVSGKIRVQTQYKRFRRRCSCWAGSFSDPCFHFFLLGRSHA